MTRKRTRQIIAIAILLLLLLLLGAAYLNYQATRNIGIDISFAEQDLLPAPQYLYSFSGEGQDRLDRPLGVLALDGRVLVTDSRKSAIRVFTPDGEEVGTWGQGKVVVPLYLAENPKTGDVYVSDRRLRAVLVFDKSGKFLREFDPKLPAEELPDFETGDVQWAPVALAFAPDGTLFVTEILNGHRLLIFAPDGSFKKSVGTAGLVNDAKQGEAVFQFPNSVKVLGKEVWVADSNNRRVQVFDREGEFKKFVVTEGLPRGFDFLPKVDQEEPQRLIVIDTLAHDATIWDAKKAEKVLTFGERGVLEAQFNYPNDLSINADRKIFIADTANGRIQVWGWPADTNPIPTPTTPIEWGLCLAPLLLLPFLLLLRRRRYFATRDFVYAMIDAGEVERMVQPRVRWFVTAEDYEELKGITQDSVAMADLLAASEYSDSDARALQERYELDMRDAIVMSLAQRSKLFCTEDPELRRIARVLEVDVQDHVEFVAAHSVRAKKRKNDRQIPPSADERE